MAARYYVLANTSLGLEPVLGPFPSRLQAAEAALLEGIRVKFIVPRRTVQDLWDVYDLSELGEALLRDAIAGHAYSRKLRRIRESQLVDSQPVPILDLGPVAEEVHLDLD